MRTYTRLAFAALVVVAAMAALVSTASARNLQTSNQAFRVTYSSLELTSFVTIRCEVTLEGSFHTRTIAKVLESLIGHITAARVKHACTGGEMFFYNGTERLEGITLPNTLPWHVRYAGFGGTLPNITSLRFAISDARVLLTSLGVRCIATTGPARGLWFGTATRNTGTGIIDNLVATGRIRFDAGSNGLCGSERSFSSRAEDGRITLLGNTTRITITLI